MWACEARVRGQGGGSAMHRGQPRRLVSKESCEEIKYLFLSSLES